jgi:hypothetical protein
LTVPETLISAGSLNPFASSSSVASAAAVGVFCRTLNVPFSRRTRVNSPLPAWPAMPENALPEMSAQTVGRGASVTPRVISAAQPSQAYDAIDR